MTRWVFCGADFVMGDILRWIEPVWKPRKSPRSKGEIIGYRLVEAQVMQCDKEWAALEIRPDGCKLHVLDGWKAEPLESVIRRRRGPIGQAQAQRLLVGDESARSFAASRYFGDQEGAVPEAPKAKAPSPDDWPPKLPSRTTRSAGHRRKGRRRQLKP